MKETLEEAARRLYYTVGNEGISSKESFIEGAKWYQEQNDLRLKHSEALLSNCEKTLEKKIQQERMYSEEEVLKFLINCPTNTEKETIEWFEQFKKK